MEQRTNASPSLREQAIILRIIGDRQRLADAQAHYFRSPEGRQQLREQGRLLELLFVPDPLPSVCPI